MKVGKRFRLFNGFIRIVVYFVRNYFGNVIHFTNNEVLENVEKVISEINLAIQFPKVIAKKSIDKKVVKENNQ